MNFIASESLGFSTTEVRPWTTDLTNIPPEGILAGAVAAIPIVLFFYLDQNISSIMCQKPDMCIKKGAYFHSSFACMALFNLLGPIWGLPFVTGSLPLMAVALLFPGLMSLLPETAVFGALIFVGLKAALGTQLWERILLFFTDPEEPMRGGYSHLSRKTVLLFTAIQILLVVGCWICNIYIGLGFPIFVVSLVPIRFKILPCIFSHEDIDALLAEDPACEVDVPEENEPGAEDAEKAHVQGDLEI